tara:strand:+ start:1508 stop:2230 length:723 start_codon:yes stop_codon:yes gene_type:complete
MKKKIMYILYVLLFLNIVFAVKQDVFILKLKYDKGEISNQLLTVTEGVFFEEKNQPNDAYRLEIISFDDSILFTQGFDFELEILSEALPEWFDEAGNQIYIPTEEESGRIILDETSKEFILPYFEDAKEINIYDKDNNLKLSIDVSNFAKLSGTVVSEKGVPIDFGFSKKGVIYILITFSSMLIILGVLFYFHRKNDKKGKIKRIKLYISKTKKRGYTKGQIKKELIKDGYTEEYFKDLL